MPSSAWKTDVCSRSEEHTSELQSLTNIVCRLLLDKKTEATRSIAPDMTVSHSDLAALERIRFSASSRQATGCKQYLGSPLKIKFFFNIYGDPQFLLLSPPQPSSD